MFRQPATAESILHLLRLVQQQRYQRQSSAGLEGAVASIKAYQQRRFAYTHADFLSNPRYGPASHFFLDELYGPRDFSERDSQFARVVPALVKLFPQDIVNTVQTLAELHALSETLDTAMGVSLEAPATTAVTYVRAWQAVGRAAERETQIALTVQLGEALDRLTRKPLLRHTLRMMRGPAQAAGLHHLHGLLEAGFDSFHSMRGARDFLNTVAQRERHLAATLFDAAVPGTPGDAASLGVLLPVDISIA